MSEKLESLDYLMASAEELAESATEWHADYLTGDCPPLPVSGDVIALLPRKP